MAWGTFTGKHGIWGIEFLEKNTTMNGLLYKAILKRKMIPHYHARECTWFMQDGAPCHNIRHSMGFLREHGVQVWPWACNSPDRIIPKSIAEGGYPHGPSMSFSELLACCYTI